MQLADYHAKYFAHELTKRCPSDSPERFAGALVDAQVDLNPHQVEATLFAFRSPLSRGALLADEVGLGKTIEAGSTVAPFSFARHPGPTSFDRHPGAGRDPGDFWMPAPKGYPVRHDDLVKQPIKNKKLQEIIELQKASIQHAISHRNARFFGAEAERLDRWADDLKVAQEREIKDMDRQIKEAKRAATLALSLEEKLTGQKQIKALESTRNSKRRMLFDAQDEIDRRREQLITDIKRRLEQKVSSENLFAIQWKFT